MYIYIYHDTPGRVERETERDRDRREERRLRERGKGIEERRTERKG